MRERPILFKGPLVHAILEGRKTVTRRPVKPQPLNVVPFIGADNRPTGVFGVCKHHHGVIDEHIRCPFGQAGDRLWVRETHAIFPAHGQHRTDGERWGPWGGLPTILSPDGKQIAYFREGFDRCGPSRWRPSIHMPRWACRLVLEITDVRVERLQAIGEADALAEGVSESLLPDVRLPRHHPRAGQPMVYANSREVFADLWDSTGGDWDANPWVWVISFRRFP